MSNTIQTAKVAPARRIPADEATAFADGVLGAAGHEVTDPTLRSILRDIAEGNISGDEGRAAGMRYLDAK